MPDEKVVFQNKGSSALNPQKRIDLNNLPFTLNPTIGCLFGCLYCYTQMAPYRYHSEFGKEVKVKKWLPKKLDRELTRHKDLPSHLKRVQVNEASEAYLPQIMNKSKELGRDIMLETLDVFRDHWEKENRWMVHLLTKSHLILKHLDKLKEMKDQVQVELTITTLDEKRRKLLEGSAPTVKKRLGVIEKLAGEGVFVRVMAMPFIGSKDEATELRKVVFDHGANAFKHKKLNYWDEGAILEGRLVEKGRRQDAAFQDLLVKSCEPFEGDGRPQLVDTVLPTPKWDNFVGRLVVLENCGYADLNAFDWGYVR